MVRKQLLPDATGAYTIIDTRKDTFVDDAAKKGASAYEAAQDAAASLEETIEDAIVQRPLATVGLAIGLGFLIGVTWRR